MSNQEALWLEEARAGDRAAFSRLVGAYQRPVFNLTYRMLGNPEEAEDAAQETFLRAYSRLHQYDPAHKFSTWLFSIANHHCIDRLRKRRVQWVPVDEAPLAYTLQSDSPQPEDSLLRMESAEEIQALVQQLDDAYRTPLILRYWNDCSYQEIADVMEISLPAVKSRLFRARQKLAELHEQSLEVQRTHSRLARQAATEQRTKALAAVCDLSGRSALAGATG